MRITVISDSHRRSSVIERILSSEPESGHVFFLGDITADIEDYELLYPEKRFHIVSGNCDFYSKYPSADMAEVGGIKIYYTHGHTLGVKYGTDNLKKSALAAGCRIALYGHTHISKISYEEGLYIVNPGSCSSPRDGAASYAVIDIEANGIMPLIKKL